MQASQNLFTVRQKEAWIHTKRHVIVYLNDKYDIIWDILQLDILYFETQHFEMNWTETERTTARKTTSSKIASSGAGASGALLLYGVTPLAPAPLLACILVAHGI
jgi:hypothetical protein